MTARHQQIPQWFGKRLTREREQRGLSMRQLAAKAEVAPSTVMRAELGGDMALSSAIALASVLDTDVAALLAEPECGTCDGRPPDGFTCRECGRDGTT